MKSNKCIKRMFTLLMIVIMIFTCAPSMTIRAYAIDEINMQAEPSDELSLKLADENKTTYKRGEPINIVATGTAPGAWVGLYKKDERKDPNSGGVTSIRWYYVTDHNGEIVDITNATYKNGNYREIDAEGDYELVLFGDDGYTNIIKTIPFRIEGVMEVDENDFSLETDKDSYTYEEAIKVKATGKGIGNAAWVGIYNQNDPIDGSVSPYFWFYIVDSEGVFKTIQSGTSSNREKILSDGVYKVVVYVDSGYSRPLEKLTKTITITRPSSLVKRIRDPQCTTLGLEYVEYKDGLTEWREVDALGHDWTEIKHIDGTSTHQYICARDAEHTKVENCNRASARIVKAATNTSNGIREITCDICQGTFTEEIPKMQNTPVLSQTSYTYDGKVKKPSVVVKTVTGQIIPQMFYSVTYPNSSQSVGIYKVSVTFKGDYKGSYSLTYTIMPKAPASAKAELYGHDDVKFTWEKSTGASGYYVYYKQSTSKSYTKYGSTTSTYIKKSNLADGMKYDFKVVPYYYYSSNKATYNSSGYTTASIYTLKKIDTPTISKSGDNVKVKWKNISGETGYQISQSKKKTGTDIVATYKTSTGSYKTISAKKGESYYYKVRAYKSVDGKLIYGPWSSVKAYKR